MTSQIISSQSTTRVRVMDCQGDLVIQVSDENTVAVENADAMPETQQQGDTLVIQPASGDLHLHVPTAATVEIENIRGALHISGVGSLSVNHADSDVRVEAVEGAVLLRDLDGDLLVRDAGSLKLEDGPRNRKQSGHERGVRDAQIHNVRVVEIEQIRRDLELREAQTARINNIGGSCTVDGVADDLRLANIGGNCAIERVGGSLQLDNVGGSVSFSTIGSVETLGNIGGNLSMNAATLNAFSPDQPIHITVGGSARIELPDAIDLTVHAMVGGKVHAGEASIANHGTLVYGNGSAHLHLIAGGNSELIGGGTPRIASGARSSWSGIGETIGREIGRAMSGEPRSKDAQRKPRSGSSAANTPTPATGPTVRFPFTAGDNATDREAVLRMVAAGQISPEDADEMLEALGA